ncbi:hypothetical protein [Actinophytocola glycyrrhizae]|uniref:Tetratricopeptide repeat protein n=1 Tax=Actinophytocola glycyrrhizae TaxID=2044873 RepID=A0ABV9S001_9PSEU
MKALVSGTENPTAVGKVQQDVIRRTILKERDVPDGANIGLISLVARSALDQGYHVLIEGILRAEQLRVRADNGDGYAAHQLAFLTDNGDGYATYRLAELLARQGELEELIHLADRGYELAAARLAALLAGQGQVEQLRVRADNVDRHAALELAALLAEQGQVDEALTLLRSLADNGGWLAAPQLAELLAGQGRVEELEGEVAAGTPGAVAALATTTRSPQLR